MTDFLLPEKISIMIKNISKPRLFYKKGISVGGFFRPYMSYSEYTSASIFSGSEVITPVTLRFSSMLGDDSTPDTKRNIKKMEVRFFTLKGRYDMLCQNIPVQFINNESKLLELFETFRVKRAFDGMNKERFWNFVINNPEAINAALHLYSSKGLSDSLININWYSVNLMLWINEVGEKYLIRTKWVPVCSETREKLQLTTNSAQFIAGFDPDVAHNELINMVTNSRFPKFELRMQIVAEKEIKNADTYDPTLIWDERRIPFISVGILMINKIIEDTKRMEICYLAGNTVEGIELCRSGLDDAWEFIYKMEAAERGIYI